jgi:pimeloyl-ACP methyl ester carboxylesterase
MSAVFVNERHRFDIGVGHSCGGAMLAWIELMRPGSFDALVLYEPIIPVPEIERISTPLSDGAMRRKSAFRSKQDAFDYLVRKSLFAKVDRAVIEAYVDHAFAETYDGHYALKCKPETEADFYTAASTQRLFDYLPKIRIPVLIMAGEHSTSSIGPDQFLHIARSIPNAEYKIMTGLGHLGPMESPSDFAREVSLFAARVKKKTIIDGATNRATEAGISRARL